MRHRDYYWEFGVSPVEEEGRGRGSNDGGVGLGVGFGEGERNYNGGGERMRCAFSGCRSKAMALTRYCHTHILSDSKQTLYKRCSYIIRRYGLELILKVESLLFFPFYLLWVFVDLVFDYDSAGIFFILGFCWGAFFPP